MKIIFDKNPDTYAKANWLREKLKEINLNETLVNEQREIRELKNRLLQNSVDIGYSLDQIGNADAGGWEGGMCLHKEDEYWLVYHSEKGGRSIPCIFPDIQSAANYFLWAQCK